MGCISSKADGGGGAAKGDNQNAAAAGAGGDAGGGNVQLDSRLPFQQYREAFQLKNYWKSVRRKESAGRDMLIKFLKDNPEFHQKYPALKDLNVDDERILSNTDFEALAANYLAIFDDVITDVESNPGNVDAAVSKLVGVGKKHKRIAGVNSGSFQGLEEPFLHMVREVLQDRFNDKCETLFRKFFQFCLKYIVQGYNEA